MICDRCGQEMDAMAYYKRLQRGTANGQCSDCNAKPSKEIKYNKEKCRPWIGEVDDDFNPYLPGIRKCEHKDCVNPKHIIRDIEHERLDISYRTGKPFDLLELLKEANA